MSNKNKTKNEKDDEPDFLYDYGNTTIYKNQYAKNVKSDGHIKIPFKVSDSVANPNLIVSSSNTKCETTNLYVFKNIHNIKEATESYDGELIIEHEPVTNSYEKYYVCFLLKTDNSLGKTNVLDKIINNTMESSETVNLNKLIPEKSKCIMNNVPNVFIFTTPIHIMSNFDKFKDMVDSGEKKFAYSSEKLESSIGKKGTSEGFSGMMKYQEGMSLVAGTNTYLECSMNGASDDTQVITTTIDSNFAKMKDENVSLITSTSILSIIIIGALSSFLVPPVYKGTIMKIIDFAENKGKITYDDKPGSLKSLDIVFIVLAIIYGITLISTSSTFDGNSGAGGPAYAGSLVLIFIVASFIIMYVKKYTVPAEYSFSGRDVEINFVFFGSLFGVLWENKIHTIMFLLLMVGIYSLIFASMYAAKAFSADEKLNYKIFNFLMSFFTMFTIPITLLLSYFYFLKDI